MKLKRESQERVPPGLPGAGRWDAWGQVLSLLCMAHCLLLPLVLSALPAVTARFFQQVPIHLGVMALAVVVGVGSFVPGFRRHQDWHVPVLGAAGLTLLGLAQVLLKEPAETAMTVAGGGLLVVAHQLNRRQCRDGCAVELDQTR